MKRLIFLLFASVLVLVACGNNEDKKEEPKKETKSKEKKADKEKGNKKKQDKEVAKQPQQHSDEQPNSQEQTVEMPQQQNNNGYQQPEQQASQNYVPQQETSAVDKNTVTEYYNGQSHTTTNNPVRDNYVPGGTDPVYEREYKHFYTPEEAQRAQEESDAILREMGLEPSHYE
ncbi:hypothetical protein [Staphylococcus pseudintermedius]|uniref:hypothetical protein n=1 Tax=Staphylococcus pseudintermedius TaxID=283734 RepID=UPI002928A557|nr:hypothetical protein [Staphylococcus pseudintermedius]MDU9326058.1 hypothetical protein [Staphylococcus pseudintermedius]